MGLDTSIDLGIRNKKTGEIVSAGVAYWRKYYGLTRTLLDIARRTEHWKAYNGEELNAVYESETTQDFETTCRPSVLNAWIKEITELFLDPDASEWMDCLWDSVHARGYTARQLEGLLVAESIVRYEFSEYTLEKFQELYDAETNEWHYNRDNPITDKFIAEVLKNPNDYEWIVYFENSY